MEKLSIGFKQAITEILLGFIFTLIADSFVKAGLIPSYAYLIFNIIFNIIFLVALPSWGILYTLGWIGGSLILLQSELMSFVDVLLNIIIPIAVLILRVIMFFKQQEY